MDAIRRNNIRRAERIVNLIPLLKGIKEINKRNKKEWVGVNGNGIKVIINNEDVAALFKVSVGNK